MFALPPAGLIAVATAAAYVSLGGPTADWSAIVLVETLAADAATAPLGYVAFSVAMVAMRLAGDRIVLSLGPSQAARWSGVSEPLGAALVAAAPNIPAALAGFALMGVGYAVVMPLAFSRAANEPGVSPGAGVAGVATFGYGGMLLGPPVVGAIGELVSLSAAFVMLAALAVAAAALASAFTTAAAEPMERPDAKGLRDPA